MKLRKTSAAVFAALMAVGVGAQAAQVASMTGTGTFYFTGQGVGTEVSWPATGTGTLTMDVSSGGTFTNMVPGAFLFGGSPVSIGSVGTGLHADDSTNTVDFRNLAIEWNSTVYPIGNENDGGVALALPPPVVMTVGSLSGGNFDIAWTGGSAAGATTWSMNGTYSVVPIPAAAWLFGSAVLGVAGLSRRRRKEDALVA